MLLAYSARNRSASCRIPYTTNPKAKRLEVRFPDPMANPYLAFTAMLMAGLDGIKNKIDPGAPMDKDLYDLPKEELKSIPTVCGSLREAFEERLKTDNAYLTAGGVFTDRLHRELYRAEVSGRDARRDDTASRSSSRCIIRTELLPLNGSRDAPGQPGIGPPCIFFDANCRFMTAVSAYRASVAR